jgi:hypothetical protein
LQSLKPSPWSRIVDRSQLQTLVREVVLTQTLAGNRERITMRPVHAATNAAFGAVRN